MSSQEGRHCCEVCSATESKALESHYIESGYDIICHFTRLFKRPVCTPIAVLIILYLYSTRLFYRLYDANLEAETPSTATVFAFFFFLCFFFLDFLGSPATLVTLEVDRGLRVSTSCRVSSSTALDPCISCASSCCFCTFLPFFFRFRLSFANTFASFSSAVSGAASSYVRSNRFRYFRVLATLCLLLSLLLTATLLFGRFPFAFTLLGFKSFAMLLFELLHCLFNVLP